MFTSYTVTFHFTQYYWSTWFHKNTKHLYSRKGTLYILFSMQCNNLQIYSEMQKTSDLFLTVWSTDLLTKVTYRTTILLCNILRKPSYAWHLWASRKSPFHALEKSRKAQTSKTIFLPRKFTDSTRFPTIRKKIVHFPL